VLLLRFIALLIAFSAPAAALPVVQEEVRRFLLLVVEPDLKQRGGGEISQVGASLAARCESLRGCRCTVRYGGCTPYGCTQSAASTRIPNYHHTVHTEVGRRHARLSPISVWGRPPSGAGVPCFARISDALAVPVWLRSAVPTWSLRRAPSGPLCRWCAKRLVSWRGSFGSWSRLSTGSTGAVRGRL
jgi:hypothetical protein